MLYTKPYWLWNTPDAQMRPFRQCRCLTNTDTNHTLSVFLMIHSLSLSSYVNLHTYQYTNSYISVTSPFLNLTHTHTNKHNFTVTVQTYQSIVFVVVILNVQFYIRIQLLWDMSINYILRGLEKIMCTHKLSFIFKKIIIVYSIRE